MEPGPISPENTFVQGIGPSAEAGNITFLVVPKDESGAAFTDDPQVCVKDWGKNNKADASVIFSPSCSQHLDIHAQ